MQALYRCIAGMDVHRMLYVIARFRSNWQTAAKKNTATFLRGSFRRDRRALVARLLELGVELVVPESTGIYWKSIYATLEKAGIPACLSSMRALSKTYWAAYLPVRFRMAGPTRTVRSAVKPSFIPPEDLRELRVVSRYREKVAQTLAGEKNRTPKVLDQASSNSARSSRTLPRGLGASEAIDGLMDAIPIEPLSDLAKGTLRGKHEILAQSLDGELTPRHRFVPKHIREPIRFLESERQSLDAYRQSTLPGN
ncbi:MAG: hypothetical protein ACRER2_19220 [Methylococcales bacterium]